MHCIELIVVFFICYKFSFSESDTVTSNGGYVVEDLKGFCTILHFSAGSSSEGVSGLLYKKHQHSK
jgi:hypothetical protein